MSELRSMAETVLDAIAARLDKPVGKPVEPRTSPIPMHSEDQGWFATGTVSHLFWRLDPESDEDLKRCAEWMADTVRERTRDWPEVSFYTFEDGERPERNTVAVRRGGICMRLKRDPTLDPFRASVAHEVVVDIVLGLRYGQARKEAAAR